VTGADQHRLTGRTNKPEVTGARRGENDAVLVRMPEAIKKRDFFAMKRCFFS